MVGNTVTTDACQNIILYEVQRDDSLDTVLSFYDDKESTRTIIQGYNKSILESNPQLFSGMVLRVPNYLHTDKKNDGKCHENKDFKPSNIDTSPVTLTYSSGTTTPHNPLPKERMVLCSKKIDLGNNFYMWDKPNLFITDKGGELYKITGFSKKNAHLNLSNNNALTKILEQIVFNAKEGISDINKLTKTLCSISTRTDKAFAYWFGNLIKNKVSLEENKQYFMMFSPQDIVFSHADRVDFGFITADFDHKTRLNPYQILDKSIVFYEKNIYGSLEIQTLVDKNWGEVITIEKNTPTYSLAANFQERLSLISLKVKETNIVYAELQEKKFPHKNNINKLKSMSLWAKIQKDYPQKEYSTNVPKEKLEEYAEYCDYFSELIEYDFIQLEGHYKKDNKTFYLDFIMENLNIVIEQLEHLNECGDVDAFINNLNIFQPESKLDENVKKTTDFYLFEENIFYEIINEAYRVISKHPNKATSQKFYFDNCLAVLFQGADNFYKLLKSSEITKAFENILYDEQLTDEYCSGTKLSYKMSEEDKKEYIKQLNAQYNLSLPYLGYKDKKLEIITRGDSKRSVEDSILFKLYQAATGALPEPDTITAKILPNLWNNQAGYDSYVTRAIKWYEAIDKPLHLISKQIASISTTLRFVFCGFDMFLPHVRYVPKGYVKTVVDILTKNGKVIAQIPRLVRVDMKLIEMKKVPRAVKAAEARLKTDGKAPLSVSRFISALGAHYAITSIWTTLNKENITSKDWVQVTNSVTSLGFSATGFHNPDSKVLLQWKAKYPKLVKLFTWMELAGPISSVLDIYLLYDPIKRAYTRGEELELTLLVISAGASAAAGTIATYTLIMKICFSKAVATRGLSLVLGLIAIGILFLFNYVKETFLVKEIINGYLESLKKDPVFCKQYLTESNSKIKNYTLPKISSGTKESIYKLTEDEKRKYRIAIWEYIQSTGNKKYKFSPVSPEKAIKHLLKLGYSPSSIRSIFVKNKDYKGNEKTSIEHVSKVIREVHDYALISYDGFTLEMQREIACGILKGILPPPKRKSQYSPLPYDPSPWLGLDHKAVTSRLIELVMGDKIISDGCLDLCWGTAFFKKIIELFPCAFAHFAVRLYNNGFAYIGDFQVDLKYAKSLGILTVIYSKVDKENKTKPLQADWMLLTSLYCTALKKSSYTGELNFPPTLSKYDRTNMKDMINKVGLLGHICKDFWVDIRDCGSKLYSLNKYVGDSYFIFMYVKSAFFENNEEGEHCIILQSQFTLKSETASFDYYYSGQTKHCNATYDFFKKNITDIQIINKAVHSFICE